MSRVLFGAYLCRRCQWHRVQKPEDMHVHVLGDHIDLAVAEDLLPKPVGEDRAESRGPVQSWEDIQDRMLPRSDFAVDPDGCHLRVPIVRVREKPIPRVAMNATGVFGPRYPLSVRRPT